MEDRTKEFNLKDLDCFLKLPRMVQERIWLDLVEEKMSGKELTTYFNFNRYSYCESPIEVIFNYFFDRVALFEYSKYMFIIDQQQMIETDNGTYRVDFDIECVEYIFPEGEQIPLEEKYAEIIVECDGHDFHEKTKAQVKRRNERDFNLKMNGYDVIHFSGSEIYNEPEKCAKKVIEYLIQYLKPSQEE